MNSTTSQDSEMKALREEVSQLRAVLSTPTLPPVPQPPSLLTPSDKPPQKKRRPDESPDQPIDIWKQNFSVSLKTWKRSSQSALRRKSQQNVKL
ncbi:hypothetical protein HPB50_024245 [Hyalomma asiaticum]|uniref:Uncharacterized protein n=1 Tax=Hyalomma asiaticum TaxID=266040 RepID=A0ACB7TSN3_HYAAI|nr:hypothetical protein HPB50_024245 [Hyalomma asiaticum]